MQLVYEMGRTKDKRAVLCLEENVVTGAADGSGRMAGKLAFTLRHVGNGSANGLANIHNAGPANTTIVNIAGANATFHEPNVAEHLAHPEVGPDELRELVAAKQALLAKD